MIEALVDYIVKQGFMVRVFQHCLIIYPNILDDHPCSLVWAIPQEELHRQTCYPLLLDEADNRLFLLREAAKKGPSTYASR